jgi:hypothetical protein
VNEEDEHPEPADAAKAADTCRCSQVVYKNQAHGNRAKEVKICEIARIPVEGRNGTGRMSEPGIDRGHVCPLWVRPRMIED